jgi:hypothetical protein
MLKDFLYIGTLNNGHSDKYYKVFCMGYPMTLILTLAFPLVVGEAE